MIYDLIIFSGGMAAGYVLTKTGHADQFIDYVKKQVDKDKKKKGSLFG